MYCFSTGSPGGHDDVEGLLGECVVLKSEERRPARILVFGSFLWSLHWWSVLEGTTGGAMHELTNLGNQGCVGQYGTIIMPLQSFTSIFVVPDRSR